MRPLFSIIIPLYNNENFIADCIESTMKQTFKNFEVIIINDGSIDKSGDIAEKYALIEDRVKVIHVDNGGVSRARNIGLSIAQGKWITFLDADDSINEKTLEIVNEQLIRDYELDLIQVSSTNSVHFIPPSDTNSFINEKNVRVNACGNFFRNSLIKQHNIQFCEGIRLGEDQLFTLEYINHCNRCVRLNYIAYNYRIHPNSSVRNPDVTSLINALNTVRNFKYRQRFETYISELLLNLLISLLSIGGTDLRHYAHIIPTYEIKLNVLYKKPPYLYKMILSEYFNIRYISIILFNKYTTLRKWK